jgi:hypothetical protein
MQRYFVVSQYGEGHVLVESQLQNCLQLADKRRGTTSVVPQVVCSGSGLSRW